MTQQEANELDEKIDQALKIAEYETLKRKAMLNQNVVISGEDGHPKIVPAREFFVKRFNEPVPEF